MFGCTISQTCHLYVKCGAIQKIMNLHAVVVEPVVNNSCVVFAEYCC